MNFKQYMEESARTCPRLEFNYTSEFLDQLHMVIGASTETNELLDAYKKRFAYGKRIDFVNVEEEIFDALWYLANLCRMLDIDIEKGFDKNIAKLRQRYPDKFKQSEAINRNLDKERKILEQ